MGETLDAIDSLEAHVTVLADLVSTTWAAGAGRLDAESFAELDRLAPFRATRLALKLMQQGCPRDSIHLAMGLDPALIQDAGLASDVDGPPVATHAELAGLRILLRALQAPGVLRDMRAYSGEAGISLVTALGLVEGLHRRLAALTGARPDIYDSDAPGAA